MEVLEFVARYGVVPRRWWRCGGPANFSFAGGKQVELTVTKACGVKG